MTGVATRTATRGGTKRVAVLVVAVVAASADLAAKVASEGRLAENPVDLGLLQLRLAHNSGVAFSMGKTLPVAVIVAVTAVICLALAAYAWHRAPQAGWVERLAGGAVIGGAVANVVDRARDGVVTDYLHTGWWPTFNLADTFVVTGALAIALLHVRHEQATDTSDEPSDPTPDDPPLEDGRTTVSTDLLRRAAPVAASLARGPWEHLFEAPFATSRPSRIATATAVGVVSGALDFEGTLRAPRRPVDGRRRSRVGEEASEAHAARDAEMARTKRRPL